MQPIRVLSGSGVALILLLSASAGCVATTAAPTPVTVPQAAPPILAAQIIVAADGSGQYKTVQEAIAAAPENSATRIVIHIKAGKYEGTVNVPRNKPNITLEGEGVEKTILSWDRNVFDPKPEGADQFDPGVLVTANDFRASNLCIENVAGDRGQALALKVDGDRALFENCRILGWQDTLMVNNGRQYFKKCYIEGRVDFIYGSGMAVFEECAIHSKNGGYVTAASTPPEQPYGLVFLNCILTGDPNPWVDPKTGKAGAPGALALLGRPWRANASVAYINCKMDDHIRPEGWSNWGNPDNEKTARYIEYGSQTLDGKPLDVSKRVAWAKHLNAAEAAQYTVPNILGGTDSNNPFGKRSPTVNRPTTLVTAPLGTLPAQNVTIYGSNARRENDGANIGFWTNTDTSFEWQSNVPAGTYKVALNYALDGAQVGSEIEVAVGDKSFKLKPDATGGWGIYKSIDLGDAEIKQPNTPVSISALSQKGDFILNLREVTLTKK